MALLTTLNGLTWAEVRLGIRGRKPTNSPYITNSTHKIHSTDNEVNVIIGHSRNWSPHRLVRKMYNESTFVLYIIYLWYI